MAKVGRRKKPNRVPTNIGLDLALKNKARAEKLNISDFLNKKLKIYFDMTSIKEQINKGDLVAFVEDGNDKRALVMDVKETFDTSVLPAKKTGCEMTFAVVGDKVFREVYFDLENNPYFISIDESKQVLDLRIDYLF